MALALRAQIDGQMKTVVAHCNQTTPKTDSFGSLTRPAATLAPGRG